MNEAEKAVQAAADFALFFKRPRNYFKLSESEQWEIDDRLGLLDTCVESKYLTELMINRWYEYFQLQKP